MKRIIALIMTAVLLIASLASCGGTVDDIAAIEKAGKIVVGITNYEPMDFKEEGSDKWVGFDAELAEQFAASLGVECEFIEIDWDTKVAELNSKEIDLIWNGMTASAKLGKQIAFSTAYAKNAQVVVVKKGSTVTKDDLAGLEIAVERGSAGATVADETVKPTKEVVKLDSQLDALFDVANGQSDAAIIDLTMAQSKLGKGEFADLVLVEGAQFSDEVFAVGLRKNSNLVEKLNEFLAAKYADGTMAALSEKYESAIVINTSAFEK